MTDPEYLIDVDEPNEEDYYSFDGGMNWYQFGKNIITCSPYECEKALREHADKEKYWPNAWFVSDHGNMIPVVY